MNFCPIFHGPHHVGNGVVRMPGVISAGVGAVVLTDLYSFMVNIPEDWKASMVFTWTVTSCLARYMVELPFLYYDW